METKQVNSLHISVNFHFLDPFTLQLDGEAHRTSTATLVHQGEEIHIAEFSDFSTNAGVWDGEDPARTEISSVRSAIFYFFSNIAFDSEKQFTKGS